MEGIEEDIAVIGFSLKFPQDADSPQSFWNMLCEGRCASTDFPSDRLNVEAHHDIESMGPRTLPLRGGHFIQEDLGFFDANFFNITPAEAKAMDPQHRLMLETSYRALENAGVSLQKCYNSSTSVYTATFTNDYQTTVAVDLETIPKYAATGLSNSMLANRVSWFYNFHGASMNLDSACSSSLSALHLACEDLRRSNSRMSLVGGSNLLFNPQFMLLLTNMGFLSPDSRCWSFDHRANGYARGEGVGVVVLKKLKNALEDGDTIRSVIRATGLNQDGRTDGGITQPSAEAQKQLIQDTLAKAQIDPSTVRYFEAHGTGTALGDPIESRGIGETFRDFRSDEDPLIIGSVKANIGHLEGASGVAGLIKTIMILEKGVIPPVAGLTKINPRIDTEYLRIHIPTQPLLWPSSGLRRALVNSFGFGGSNATVILDDAYHYLLQRGLIGCHRTSDLEVSRTLLNNISTEAMSSRTSDSGIDVQTPSEDGSFTASTILQHKRKSHRPLICTWSAADETALNNTIAAYQSHAKRYLAETNDSNIEELVYTLTARRTRHAWRSYLVVSSEEELYQSIESTSTPTKVSTDPRSVAFVFTGQGAAYAKMAHGLFVFQTFRETIARLDGILRTLGYAWSLEEVLADAQAKINSPELSQTATTAIQIAMVHLLRSFGVVPSAVVGHSSGEIAAAYCANAIDETSAMRIAYHRGRLSATLDTCHSENQSMMAVGIDQDTLRPFMDRLGEDIKVQIGCLNSPESITVTGDEAQLLLLESQLKEQGYFARKLPMNVAYHSVFMKPIEKAYLESLDGLCGGSANQLPIPMISSVTANIVPSAQLKDPNYWTRNLVSQVRFSEAMSLLCNLSGKAKRKQIGANAQSLSGITDLLEIGPHSTLQGPIRDIMKSTSSQGRLKYLAALTRSRDAATCILNTTGLLFTLGYPIDLMTVNNMTEGSYPVLHELPEYGFNHSQRHWSEDRISSDMRLRSHIPHELLGTWMSSSSPLEGRWRNFLTAERIPWAVDHHIGGECVLPGAGMLAMAIEATKQLIPRATHVTKISINDVHFMNALRVPEDGDGIETQISLSSSTAKNAGNSRAFQFRLVSFEAEWTDHCRGSIDVEFEEFDEAALVGTIGGTKLMDKISAHCTETADTQKLYSTSKDNGVNYGPTFQVLDNVRYSHSGHAFADLVTNPAGKIKLLAHKTRTYTMHPSMLDGLFQLVFSALYQGGNVKFPTMVPTFVKALTIFPTRASSEDSEMLQASCVSSFQGYRETSSDVVATIKRDGRVFATMDGYRTTFLSASEEALDMTASDERPMLSHIVWHPDLDMLKPEQIRTVCESLEQYLRLLSHKNPTMKILHILEASETEDVAAYARVLSETGTSRWSTYDVAQLSSSQSEAQKDLENSFEFVQLKNIDIGKALDDQDMELGIYDLVIATDVHPHPIPDFEFIANEVQGHAEIDERSAVYQRLRELLKDDGRLILSTGMSSSSVAEMTPSLLKAGFNRIESEFPSSGADSSDSKTIIVSPLPSATLALSTPNLTLVINSSSSDHSTLAASLATAFKNQGISNITITTLSSVFETQSQQSQPCIFLLDYGAAFWDGLSETEFETFQALLPFTPEFLWVVKDTKPANAASHPRFHIVDGLLRVLRSEDSKRRIVRLKLDSEQSSDHDVSVIAKVLQQSFATPLENMEPEYEERTDGCLYINRVVQSPDMNKALSQNLSTHKSLEIELGSERAPPLEARLVKPGDVGSVRMEEVSLPNSPLGDDEILVHVHAVGLSQRDYLCASGKLNSTRIFSECAGVVAQAGLRSKLKSGDCVMLVGSNVFRTHVRCRDAFAVKIPEDMDFAEAASLPTALVLASFAFLRNSELDGDSVVLVHHAAGALGQACIQVARNAGATVLATAGSQSKRVLLEKSYGLSAETILDSSDANLLGSIQHALDGRSVDFAINFTPSDITISDAVLSTFGHMVDLGIFSATEASHSVPAPTSKCATISSLNISELAAQRPHLIRKAFQQISPLLFNGAIKPATPIRQFTPNNITDALHWFQDRKGAGKVVMNLSPGLRVKASIFNQAATKLDPNATYVIAGGFGGIGRTICRWFVSRGARHLLVLSRSGMKGAAAQKLARELREKNVEVVGPACDITNASLLRTVLQEFGSKMPPIRGCMQCTMVLRDAIFENMTYDDYITATRPKTDGSWNLHELLPAGMQFFVMLSSIVGILGAHSQANYAAGNTYKDSLSHFRVAMGEKATAIDLGMMVTEGVVTETDDMLDSLRRLGWFMEISQEDFLALLDLYCDPTREGNEGSSQVVVGIDNPVSMEAKGIEPPEWINRPLFKHSHLIARDQRVDAAGSKGKMNFETILRHCSSADEAAENVVGWLLERVSQLMGVPSDDMDVRRPLHTVGVNSLSAVELRNWLDRRVGSDVTMFNILGNMSILELAANAVENNRFFG